MGKYQIAPATQFKKDLKKYLNRNEEKQAISEVIDLLAANGNKTIPSKMKPHKLSGKYNGYWECHIKPDLLLIWLQTELPVPKIYLTRVGAHAELF